MWRCPRRRRGPLLTGVKAAAACTALEAPRDACRARRSSSEVFSSAFSARFCSSLMSTPC